MATTANLVLSDEQREKIAAALRLPKEAVPTELGILAISPEAGEHLGLPKDMESKFIPAMIIT